MQIFNSIEDFSKTEYCTSVALGFFDGVHLGHKKVFDLCNENKGNLKSAVFVFKNSPALSFNKEVFLLTTNKQKEILFEKSNIDFLIYEDFDNIKNITAEEFVDEILYNKLKARKVFCGFNYHFGKSGTANSKTLKNLSSKKGIEVFEASPVLFENEYISSTRIRNCIKKGEIKKANSMLGYNFTISGSIEKGKQNGRSFGTPTINLPFTQNKLIPKYGVYRSHVSINNNTYLGATNIGIHPTVGKVDPVCETNLINIKDIDLYNVNVDVKLLDFIREEIHFSTVDELISQIKIDVNTIIDIEKEDK